MAIISLTGDGKFASEIPKSKVAKFPMYLKY